ncbi:MAG: C39 family peptidase, partial [Turicibacter sp.]|nr:C39 family peptidase [Turicibacter sp.]
MKKGLILGMIALLIFGLMTLYSLTPFPKKDTVTGSLPSTFSIATDNSFETQVHNECSAFSTAYVLRHFGESSLGMKLYEQFNFKIPFLGYVLPKGILNYFNDSDYIATLYHGSFETLKLRLLEGTPIIVLIGDGFHWQHYMTLVGFDEDSEEVYFFDSLRQEDENKEAPGNRTLSTDYFLQLWDNGLPIFHHIYFT